MTALFAISAVLAVVGIIFVLGLTPEVVTNDIIDLFTKKSTLRQLSINAQKRRKKRGVADMLRRVNDALRTTGRESQFTIICTSSLILLIVGCIVPFIIDNVFIMPIMAVTLAAIPFLYAKRTVGAYEQHMRDELETSLSIITMRRCVILSHLV